MAMSKTLTQEASGTNRSGETRKTHDAAVCVERPLEARRLRNEPLSFSLYQTCNETIVVPDLRHTHERTRLDLRPREQRLDGPTYLIIIALLFLQSFIWLRQSPCSQITEPPQA